MKLGELLRPWKTIKEMRVLMDAIENDKIHLKNSLIKLDYECKDINNRFNEINKKYRKDMMDNAIEINRRSLLAGLIIGATGDNLNLIRKVKMRKGGEEAYVLIFIIENDAYVAPIPEEIYNCLSPDILEITSSEFEKMSLKEPFSDETINYLEKLGLRISKTILPGLPEDYFKEALRDFLRR